MADTSTDLSTILHQITRSGNSAVVEQQLQEVVNSQVRSVIPERSLGQEVQIAELVLMLEQADDQTVEAPLRQDFLHRLGTDAAWTIRAICSTANVEPVDVVQPIVREPRLVTSILLLQLDRFDFRFERLRTRAESLEPALAQDDLVRMLVLFARAGDGSDVSHQAQSEISRTSLEKPRQVALQIWNQYPGNDPRLSAQWLIDLSDQMIAENVVVSRSPVIFMRRAAAFRVLGQYDAALAEIRRASNASAVGVARDSTLLDQIDRERDLILATRVISQELSEARSLLSESRSLLSAAAISAVEVVGFFLAVIGIILASMAGVFGALTEPDLDWGRAIAFLAFAVVATSMVSFASAAAFRFVLEGRSRRER